jgi:type VI protein secretion system component Hcp
MNASLRSSFSSRSPRHFGLLVAILLTQFAASPLSAMIVVVIPGIEGSVTVGDLKFSSAFVADSFSFGVEREMKESGEKGGTEDINIGVGELQECTISKSMDRGSSLLAQFAINGNSPGTAEIYFVETAGSSGKPYVYLKYKLGRCFVKSWLTSGDADDRPTEEVAFYFNRIAFIHRTSTDGMTFETYDPAGWDRVTQTPWTEVSFDPEEPR